jgi:hypothetical protein
MTDSAGRFVLERQVPASSAQYGVATDTEITLVL